MILSEFSSPVPIILAGLRGLPGSVTQTYIPGKSETLVITPFSVRSGYMCPFMVTKCKEVPGCAQMDSWV